MYNILSWTIPLPNLECATAGRVYIITCEFVKLCYNSINRVYLLVTFLQYIIDAVEVAVFSINNGSHGYLNVKGVFSAPAQLTCMLWADNKRPALSTTVHILSYVLKGPLVIPPTCFICKWAGDFEVWSQWMIRYQMHPPILVAFTSGYWDVTASF